MATLLNTKQKKEIEVFLPNFEERKFIKEAIDEKICSGLIKNGYSPEQMIKDFKD